jgi:cobalt-zinc-cadmium efflux system membrane fusion protein
MVASSVLLSVFEWGCSPSDSGNGKGQSAGGPARGAPDAALCKHEVAETFCPICHPEVLKDPKVLLCKEHGNIPEEVCTACHPELKAKYKTCEHELPPALCAACQKKSPRGEGAK